MPQLVTTPGSFLARTIYTLATSGNRPHDPRAWAAVVAAGMVSIDEAIRPERKAAAFNVRQQIALVLLGAFSSLKATTTIEDITEAANVAEEKIERILARSHWAFEASADEIRTEFKRYITLNLADAASLIRRLE